MLFTLKDLESRSASAENLKGENVEVANQVQQLLYINCDIPLEPLDILRR